MNKRNLKKRKTKKIVVVARTATKNPEQNDVEMQVRWAEEKTEDLDVEITRTISVNGMSEHRFIDEYEKIIIDIVRKDKIDYLLVYDFSRLTRSLSNGMSLANELINCGCTIVSKYDVIDSDFLGYCNHIFDSW